MNYLRFARTLLLSTSLACSGTSSAETINLYMHDYMSTYYMGQMAAAASAQVAIARRAERNEDLEERLREVQEKNARCFSRAMCPKNGEPVGSELSDTSKTKSHMTGNDLLDYCSNPDSLHMGMCLGYLRGVHDGQKIGYFAGAKEADPASTKTLDANGSRICGPTNPDLRQMKDVVLSYLIAHPDTRHYPAEVLTTLAFEQAWPCLSKN